MADVFARVRAGGGGGALQPKTLVGDQGAHHRGGFACGSADPGGARLVLVEGKPPFGRTGAPPPPTHTPPAIILTHRVAAQAGFFQRASQKNKDAEEELKRDSWDYVPKRGVRGESAS